MAIEGKQRKALREALESAFPNREKLERMLGETNSGDLRDIPGSAYSDIVFNLIDTAESEGWLPDLLVGARCTNPGNPKLQNFIVKFINVLFDEFYSTSTDLSQQLIQLLQGLPSFDAVVAAVYRTLPNGVEDHSAFLLEELKSDSLKRSIRIFALLKLLLKDYPHIGILPFVNQLLASPRLDPAFQPAIQQWLNEAQTQTGQVLPPVSREQSNQEKNPCLLVTVRQPVSNELRFLLSASFSLSGNNEELEPFGEAEIHEKRNKEGAGEFINTRAWINQQLDRAEEEIHREPPKVEVKELTLEVFLPCEYLLETIDQWELESEPGAKVGRRYRVVARSYDRFYSSRWSNLLRRNWRQMQQDLNSESKLQAREKLLEHLDCFEVCQWNKLEISLGKSFGLKLTCAPSEKERDKLFLTILKSGAPIAFWTRRNEIENLDLCIEMDRFLIVDLLRNRTEFLERIRVERENAYAAVSDHLGNHLAILWDDPSRVPVVNPLKAG